MLSFSFTYSSVDVKFSFRILFSFFSHSKDGKFLLFLSAKTAVDSGAHGATESLHKINWPSDEKLPESTDIVNVVRDYRPFSPYRGFKLSLSSPLFVFLTTYINLSTPIIVVFKIVIKFDTSCNADSSCELSWWWLFPWPLCYRPSGWSLVVRWTYSYIIFLLAQL